MLTWIINFKVDNCENAEVQVADKDVKLHE